MSRVEQKATRQRVARWLSAISLIVATGCQSATTGDAPQGGGTTGAASGNGTTGTTGTTATTGTRGPATTGADGGTSTGTGGASDGGVAGNGADGGAGGTGASDGGAGDAAKRDAVADAPGFDVPVGPNITIIQEDQPGFDAVDGKVFPRQGSTSITGYTGSGFCDSDPGAGKTISWSVSIDVEAGSGDAEGAASDASTSGDAAGAASDASMASDALASDAGAAMIDAPSAGTYTLIWRYAFGGAADNLRDAKLILNGVVAADMVSFAYTGTWNDWAETAPVQVELAPGANFIQLVALGAGGLANIDYLEIIGPNVRPDTPSFSLTVNASDPAAGTVSRAPVQTFYPYGSMVTLTAVANSGYFFQSWTGDFTSANASATFAIKKNTVATARFLPTGTTQDPAVVGYATVQDDDGTPYLINGGSLGASVIATTLDELKTYLSSPDPYVVSFSGLFQGADVINIASNKTLLGVGAAAHFDGIELEINGSRNVIVRNVTVSNVIADGAGLANDAIEITGAAKNIWIDHCELYSDLDHGKDYYDGLLDIKNESSFITVSWCTIHHHFKASLISSGEEQVGDVVIRATYHHNYFHDCGSRLPSIRFGKAHIFDNYYENNTTGSCVNSRMGAVVRVENNYFQNSKDPIGFSDSPMTGYWDVANNVFSMCTGTQPTTSTGQLTPPYPYTLDPPANLPTSIVAGAGVGKP